MRQSTSITGCVRWLVGLSVTHSFDDPHVAPYWPSLPCCFMRTSEIPLRLSRTFASFLKISCWKSHFLLKVNFPWLAWTKLLCFQAKLFHPSKTCINVRPVKWRQHLPSLFPTPPPPSSHRTTPVLMTNLWWYSLCSCLSLQCAWFIAAIVTTAIVSENRGKMSVFVWGN